MGFSLSSQLSRGLLASQQAWICDLGKLLSLSFPLCKVGDMVPLSKNRRLPALPSAQRLLNLVGHLQNAASALEMINQLARAMTLGTCILKPFSCPHAISLILMLEAPEPQCANHDSDSP